MKFGVKKSEAPAQGGDYLRNFSKGETKGRFLEEPEEWYLYYEHYTDDGKAFPCTQDTSSCPGCTSESEKVQRRSRKYGTFFYNAKWNETVPVKLPMTLANRLTTRAERNAGTLTNRDYIVIKSGAGLQTEYDVDQDEKYSVNIEQLRGKSKFRTVEEVLQIMFEEVWGDPKQYEQKDEYRSGRPKQEIDKQIAVDDDVPDTLKTADERAQAHEVAEAHPESEEEITEVQLRAMKRSQLKEIWEKAGFTGFNEDWENNEIVDAILERAE